MLTKSELLRDASNKLWEQAHIERAKAERVRAAAIEARELSQRQLLRIRASNVSAEVNPSHPHVLVNPFPSHVLATVLGHCDSREGLGRCEYNVSPGNIFAVDLYKGG